MTRKTVHSAEKKEAMLKNHIAILRGLLEKKSMPLCEIGKRTNTEPTPLTLFE